jgi:multimeric flavodoxin WrbA
MPVRNIIRAGIREFKKKSWRVQCSLKSSKSRERSSTDALMQQLFGELAKQGATGKIVRAADYNIKPGVKSDEGKGDDWPGLRRQLLAADILVIGAPIWLGQPSSIAKRVMKRMDAFLDEKDERGRMPSYGKEGDQTAFGFDRLCCFRRGR